MLTILLAALFPRRCMGCRRPGIALCDTCLHKIRFADNTGRDVFAVYDYGNRLVRHAIRQFKYYRRSEAVRTLARTGTPFVQEFLGDVLQSTNVHQFILVPIPEHPHKLRIKGFNQSVLLAKWWSDALPESRVEQLLEKVVFTMPQAKLNRTARLHNVRDTMHATRILDPHPIYLIVDDVTTTGATFTEARRALRDAGAKKIFSIALAHGYAQK